MTGWYIVPERIPSLVAGAALLALAVWLLWLDLGRRLHRAFALFLFLRAFFVGLLGLGLLVEDPAGRLRVYFAIALPFAALYFALVYRRQYSLHVPGASRSRWLPWVLLAFAVGVEALYFWNHALFAELRVDGTRAGPLTIFIPLAYAAFAYVALLFASDARTAPPGPARRALAIAAFGFVLEPLYQSLVQAIVTWESIALGAVSVDTYFEKVLLAERLAWVIPLVLVAAFVIRAAPLLSGSAALSRRGALVLALPVASALVVGVLYAWEVRTRENYFSVGHFFLDALWTLVAPAAVTYALVRHRFLQVDLKLKRAVSRSALAGIFVAAFFAASETAQALLQDTFQSSLVGIVGAAVLVFALHPLQRLADHIAGAAVPAKPLQDADHAAKVEAYREQVTLAWMDGSISAKQRHLLNQMREHLGLSFEEAARLEVEATAQSRQDAKSPPRKATRARPATRG